MKSVNIMRIKMVREKELKYEAISCVSDAVSILKAFGLEEEAEEKFIILCLNTKGEVIGLHEVSHGELSTAPVHPREVFKRALLNNAASIIASHNHPSGNSEPSSEDRIMTERLEAAGRLLGIKVLDHIIIGENNHYSFREHGDMME